MHDLQEGPESMNLFRRRKPEGLAESDRVVIEYNPEDRTQYRLIRYQAQEGDHRESRTILRPADWDGPGVPR